VKIELTKEDCQNVRVALTLLAKSPQTSVDEMKVALILSDKFVFKEEDKQVVADDKLATN
jgi:hypothetical protein